MPDKPLWYGTLDDVIKELEGLSSPWIDRQTVEHLLKVGRRRAQQIMQPVSRSLGSSGIVDRDKLIAHLKLLASGDQAHFERRRRERLADVLELQGAPKRPRVLVQAPTTVVNQTLTDLPEGVSISPGTINIQFSSPTQALEKLLALAMAIGNNFDEFGRVAGPVQS